MPYTTEEKKKALVRLRRIRGQAEALETAVEEGTECGLLLQQLSALRGAVNGLMGEIMESHLRETFGDNKTKLSQKDLHNNLNDALKLIRSYLK